MRLRKLETNAGTVLVFDQLTPAEAQAPALTEQWDGREPRPFVIAVVGDLEIPSLDQPAQYAYGVPQAPQPYPSGLGPSRFSPPGGAW